MTLLEMQSSLAHLSAARQAEFQQKHGKDFHANQTLSTLIALLLNFLNEADPQEQTFRQKLSDAASSSTTAGVR